ncbi:MAG: zinc dependent phospholipase C family protein [Chloroflexota bacterium]
MHLHIAELIRAQAGENGRLAASLNDFWPAFYLGSVAPDCQEVAHISREQTHFYDVPPATDNLAYPRMLAQYPQLADGLGLPPAQAMFVAAYSVHLLYDLIWFRDILMPYFVNAKQWADGRDERRMVHHIVLTYLDKLAYEALPETAVSTLSAAQPDHWLPFVSDEALCQWQHQLTTQLEPTGELETINVYAGRLGMSPAEFAANLDDTDWMEAHVFQNVPVGAIQQKLETAVTDSIALICQYLHID